jgi:CRP-like cAMP-binding protein
MPKQDIATYLQMSPETLSRTIGELRAAGLLTVEGDRFSLPDVQRARVRTRL